MTFDLPTHYAGILKNYSGARRESMAQAINDYHAITGRREPADVETLEGLADDWERKQPWEITKGFKSGLQHMQASGYGALGLAGSAVGNDSIRDIGYEGYQRNMQEAEGVGPRVGRVEDIESFGDLGDWFMGTLGSVAPSVIEAGLSALIGGGVGGLVARKAGKEAIENAVEGYVKKKVAEGIAENIARKNAQREVVKFATRKGVDVGRNAGLVLGVGGVEAGGNFGQSADEIGVENVNPYVTGAAGLAAGLTSLIGPEGQAAKAIAGGGVKGLARREIVPHIAGNMVKEGVQEVAEQGIGDVGRLINNPDAEISGSDYLNSFAGGVAAGLGFSAPPAVKGLARPRQESKPLTDTSTDIVSAARGDINQQTADRIGKPETRTIDIGHKGYPFTPGDAMGVQIDQMPDFGLGGGEFRGGPGAGEGDYDGGVQTATRLVQAGVKDIAGVAREVSRLHGMPYDLATQVAHDALQGGVKTLGLQLPARGTQDDISAAVIQDNIAAEEQAMAGYLEMNDPSYLARVENQRRMDVENISTNVGGAGSGGFAIQDNSLGDHPHENPDQMAGRGGSQDWPTPEAQNGARGASPGIQAPASGRGGLAEDGLRSSWPGKDDGGLGHKITDPGQLQFIQNKVSQLGSVASVDKFYDLEDDVSKYARQYAREVFNVDTRQPAETDNTPKQNEIQKNEQSKSSYPEGVKLTSKGNPYRKRGAENAAALHTKKTGEQTELVQLGKKDFGWRVVSGNETDFATKAETPVDVNETSRGARRATEEGAARIEKAQGQLRDIINNPDIIGKQRADRVADGKNLVQFLEAYADKDLETDHHRGDLVAYTGEDAPNGFRSIIYLEGDKAGKHDVKATVETVEENAKRNKENWEEQQAGFRRLRESQEGESPRSEGMSAATEEKKTRFRSKEHAEQIKQLAEDQIETKKRNGDKIPQHLVERAREAREYLETGRVNTENGAASQHVFGHPESTWIRPDKYTGLVPIRVRSRKAVESYIEKSQSAFDELAKKIGEREYKAKKGDKKAKKQLKESKHSEEIEIRDLIRNETMPELKRLLDMFPETTHQVSTDGAGPETAPASKEPWQMTRDEYHRTSARKAIESHEETVAKKGRVGGFNEQPHEMAQRLKEAKQSIKNLEPVANGDRYGEYYDSYHRMYIKKAIHDGKKIPQDVMESQPDLIGLTKEEAENYHDVGPRKTEESKATENETKPDRRKDPTRRKAVSEMSHEEMKQELLTDYLTGLGNKRAYEESLKKKHQVSIDADALKWVNDNLGHPAGDRLLKMIGKALKQEGLEAYHISGDEYYLQGDDADFLEKAVKRAYDYLKNNPIEVTLPDGTSALFTGGFSYGRGQNIEEAETRLHEHKTQRELSGERSVRGQEPTGSIKRLSEGNKDQDRRGDVHDLKPEESAKDQSSQPEEPGEPKRKNTGLTYKKFKGDGTESVKSYYEYRGYKIAIPFKGMYEIVEGDKSVHQYAGMNGAVDKIDSLIGSKDSSLPPGVSRSDIKLSQSESTPTKKADISELSPKQRRTLNALTRNGKVEIVTAEEAAKLIGQGAESYGQGERIQGAFLNGKAYIIPGNVESGKLWAVIRHEVGVHMGQLLQDNKGFDRLKRAFNAKRNEQSPTGEAIRKAFDKVPEDTKAEHVTEEAMAYLVEHAPEIGFAKRILNFLKRILVKLGVSESIFTADDFAAMADAALRKEAKRPLSGTTKDAMKSTRKYAGKWFSQMQSFLSDKLPGKGTGQSFLDSIRSWSKKGEFKQEELEWSGLEDWLKEQDGKVSKQDVLGYLAENEVRVEEVEKGVNLYENSVEEEARDRFEGEFTKSNEGWSMYMADAVEMESANAWDDEQHQAWGYLRKSREEYIAETEDEDGDVDEGEARDNFRDDFIDLDWDEVFTPDEYESIKEGAWDSERQNAIESVRMERDDDYDPDGENTKFSDYQLPGGDNYKELLLVLPGKEGLPDGFKLVQKSENKWIVDGPGPLSENQYASGASREEVLGAFSKHGHKGGYKSSHWDESNVLAHIRFNERTGPNGEKILFIEEIQSDWHQEGRKKGYGGKGAPDAPFKKSWPILSFKRMVRYAAENGFDTIAWTPGGVQADRYDLSRQIDEVAATRTGNGYKLTVKYKNEGSTETSGIQEQELENYVGKELADKIINQEDGRKVYSGLDLKVGGEGMKGFYDKILPAEVNKFFNKATWGNAKVGQTDIGDTKTWSLPVTQEMKEKALFSGMPLFSKSQGHKKEASITADQQAQIDEDISSTLDYLSGVWSKRGELWPITKNVWANRNYKDPGDKADASWVEKSFDLVSHYSKKSKAFYRTFKHALAHQDIKVMIERELTHGVDENGKDEKLIETLTNFEKADKKGYQRLSKYLDRRDMEQRGYRVVDMGEGAGENRYVVHTPTGKETDFAFEVEREAWDKATALEAEDYVADGGSEQAAMALKRIRAINNNMYDMRVRRMNELIEYCKQKNIPVPEIVEYVNGKEVAVNLKQALLRMGDHRGYYMPRQRKSGEHVLYAKKDGESPLMKFYDARAIAMVKKSALERKGYTVTVKQAGKMSEGLFEKLGSVVAQQAAFNEAMKKIERGNKTITIEDLDLKGEWKDGNYIVSGGMVGEFKEALESMGGKRTERHKVRKGYEHFWTEYVFENAKPELEQNVTDVLFKTKGIVPDIALQFAQAMVSQYADVLRSRGSRSAMIARSGAYAVKKNQDGKYAVVSDSGKALQRTFDDYESANIAAREMTARGVVRGYEEDAITRVAQAAYSLAGGEAKSRTALNMIKAISGHDVTWDQFKEIKRFDGKYSEYEAQVQGTDAEHIDRETFNEIKTNWVKSPQYVDYIEFIEQRGIDPGKQKSFHNEAMALFSDMMRNEERADRVIGTLKGLAVLKYLGFRVAAPVVNVTNMVVGVPAAMMGYGKIPVRKIFKHIGTSYAEYTRYLRGKELAPDMQKVFEEIERNGWDKPHFNHESVGALKNQFGRGYAKLIDTSMIMFDWSERFNRAATIAGAYKGLLETMPDLTFKERMRKAYEISNKAHGIYAKANRPSIMRGGGIAANAFQTAYVFKTFTHNFLATMADLGLREKDAKAVAWMAFSPVIFGVGSSVGTTLLVKAIGSAMGSDDPEEDFYRAVESRFGSYAGNFSRFGIFGALENGISIKGSLAVGVSDIPTSFKDLIGAPGSVITDVLDGIKETAKGNVSKGIESMLPLALSNPIKAYREATEGITTRSNAPVFFQGKPLKADAIDAFLRALSFNPSRIAGAREKLWADKKQGYTFQDHRSDIYSRLRKYYVSKTKDAKALRDIEIEIAAYNQKAKGAGQALITRKSIKSVLKRAKVQ